MKKIVLLSLIFVNIAYGFSYNDILLKAQASIFPKILLLDKKLDNKLINKEIVYTIVYEKIDYLTALEISNFIDKNYNGYFGKYPYSINLVQFSDISTQIQASAIYVLNSDKNIRKIVDIAKTKGVITFSYDIDNLKEGLLFSLMLEKSTVIYLNKENLYTKDINFVDPLYQIIKFIDKQ